MLEFNDLVRRKEQGADIDISRYNYFEYVGEPESMLMDRVLELVSRPIFTDMQGVPQFIFNVYGLTIRDLLELDIATLDKLETSAERISTDMGKRVAALDKSDLFKELANDE